MFPILPHLVERAREALRDRQQRVMLGKIFGNDGRKKIAHAIRAAEAHTSGEIVLRVRKDFDSGISDAMAQARKDFARLNLHQTKGRTAVLVLLVWERRQLKIYADEGVAARLNQEFFDNLVNRLARNFRGGKFIEPLCAVIHEVGAALAREFPGRSDEVNEISDDLSLDEGDK